MAPKITLLEIDAPNAQFNAPFSGRETEGSTGADAIGGPDHESDEDSSGIMVPVLVLLGFIALAAVARFLWQDSAPEPEPESESEAGAELNLD